MDSEAVFHYVVAKNDSLRQAPPVVPEPLTNAWKFPDSAALLQVAKQWCALNCVGDWSAWVQYGKNHTILAQFENPDDAFAFKMRFG